ncbi:DNRLRE domain-containing protein [Clostridium ganghwense]|uniref:DNRLRE domain-containing protein n=1 Tax=Clostridium ganghwense TaxID=312089 RepID=A0ABT4CPP4_9CLOT|nr:DNRLRE domain-containing protein [Clostridium ganghwense]
MSSKFPQENINGETIIVGNDGNDFYGSYLFFDTSSIPDNISIHSSEIVLFKVTDFFYDYNKNFSICPIADYFSSFTSYETRPKIYKNFSEIFNPFTCGVAVEIDITNIVRGWLQNLIINKGLFLYSSNSNSSLTSFGSALSKDNYLIPILRVSFKKSPIPVNLPYVPINKYPYILSNP